MANTKQVVAGATTITSTTGDNLVVLTPAVQKKVNILRENRDIAKQAKEIGDNARDAILEFVGDTATKLIGTDAKGKRLVSVKPVASRDTIDLKRVELEMPELYAILKEHYTVPADEKVSYRVELI